MPESDNKLKNTDSSLTVAEEKLLVMGRFGKTHGIKGFLKVNSYTVPADNLLDYAPWYIKESGVWKELELDDGHTHGRGIIVKPTDCQDPESATVYTGLDIAVLRDQLPELEPNQFYWADLLNLSVITINGDKLGQVDHLLETGGHDVLVIKDETRERMVPFVWDIYVKAVDLEQKTITVDWDPEF